MSSTNGLGYAFKRKSCPKSSNADVQSSKVKMTASEPVHPAPSVTSTPTTSVPGMSVWTTANAPEAPVVHSYVKPAPKGTAYYAFDWAGLSGLKTDRSKRAVKQRYRALRRTYNEAERRQPCDHLLHMYRRVPA